jgi:hypothetical protein
MNKNSTEKQNFLSCISNQMQLHSKSFPAVFSHPVSHPGNFCAQKRNYLRAETKLSPRRKNIISAHKGTFLHGEKYFSARNKNAVVSLLDIFSHGCIPY